MIVFTTRMIYPIQMHPSSVVHAVLFCAVTYAFYFVTTLSAAALDTLDAGLAVTKALSKKTN